MKKIWGGAIAAALASTSAYAGGVERTGFSSGILFEEGTYAELSFARVSPTVTGTQEGEGPIAAVIGFLGATIGGSSGDVANDFWTVTGGYKRELNDRLHFALVFDQPIGADISYANPDYLYGVGSGSNAEISSNALTALLRYELQNNFSVYGGLRYQQAAGEVDLFTGYQMESSTEGDFGYLLGVAWEKPEIAARVALTYQSSITHDFDATEINGGTTSNTGFQTEVPQSLLLEFQTGVAANTLLFGSIKWTDWTEFDITPEVYTTEIGGSLVSYDEDVFSYTLGVGRRFNETWSGAVTVGFEEAQGGFSANLGPTDGFLSLGLGATYTRDAYEVSFGGRYTWIGDAETESPLAAGTTQGSFEGSSAVILGVKLAYNF